MNRLLFVILIFSTLISQSKTADMDSLKDRFGMIYELTKPSGEDRTVPNAKYDRKILVYKLKEKRDILKETS